MRSRLILVLLLASCRAPDADREREEPGENERPGQPRADREAREEVDHEDPSRAYKLFLERRLPRGADRLSWDRYWDAEQQRAGMAQFSLALDALVQAGGLESFASVLVGTWTELGPGNIGARARALVVHRT